MLIPIIALFALGAGTIVFEFSSIVYSQKAQNKKNELTASHLDKTLEDYDAAIKQSTATTADLSKVARAQSWTKDTRQDAGQTAKLAATSATTSLDAIKARQAAQEKRLPTAAEITDQNTVDNMVYGRAALIVGMCMVTAYAAGACLRRGRELMNTPAPTGGQAVPTSSASDLDADTHAPRPMPSNVTPLHGSQRNQHTSSVLEPTHQGALEPTQATDSPTWATRRQQPAANESVLEPTHPGALEPAHPTSAAPTKQRQPRKTSAATGRGKKADTGTNGPNATRYKQVRDDIMAKRTKPGLRAVTKKYECWADTARGYLNQMTADGLLVRKENGQWDYAPQHKAAA